jgi:HEXXH motif-containing protein
VLPTDPPIPSPWKGVPRPPLAILHSAFAFATVVRYLDALQVEPVDGYDTGRAGLERRIIADHLARIDEVLAVVPSAGIRDLVAAQVRLALES